MIFHIISKNLYLTDRYILTPEEMEEIDKIEKEYKAKRIRKKTWWELKEIFGSSLKKYLKERIKLHTEEAVKLENKYREVGNKIREKLKPEDRELVEYLREVHIKEKIKELIILIETDRRLLKILWKI